MRVGKTLISLGVAYRLKAQRVLFITKKKAISSIVKDYENLKESYPQINFQLDVVNYEQVNKKTDIYDVYVVDEAHSLGAFPKPSLRTKNIKSLVGNKYLILLSGTPSPESYSQLYHQLYISENSPFRGFKNFYQWAKVFVNIKQKYINGYTINDYSKAIKSEVDKYCGHLFITYTQQQAGFQSVINEKVINIKVESVICTLLDKIKKDRIISFDDDEILADTPAKLLTKLHQISSGHAKTENNNTLYFCTKKVQYINDNYKDKKIAIFYQFKAEEDLLKSYLKKKIVYTPEEFNNTDKETCFISQMQSGAMGTNLSSAEIIVFYNIAFSALLYWQARARSQHKDKTDKTTIHWLFSDVGIEKAIYEAVQDKKDFTLSYYRKKLKELGEVSNI